MTNEQLRKGPQPKVEEQLMAEEQQPIVEEQPMVKEQPTDQSIIVWVYKNGTISVSQELGATVALTKEDEVWAIAESKKPESQRAKNIQVFKETHKTVTLENPTNSYSAEIAASLRRQEEMKGFELLQNEDMIQTQRNLVSTQIYLSHNTNGRRCPCAACESMRREGVGRNLSY